MDGERTLHSLTQPKEALRARSAIDDRRPAPLLGPRLGRTTERPGRGARPVQRRPRRKDMHETKASATEFVLSHDYNDGGRGYWATFLKDLAVRGLPHERYLHWNTTADNLDDMLEYATHSSKLAWGSAVLLDLEAETGCVAAVWMAAGGVSAQFAAE